MARGAKVFVSFQSGQRVAAHRLVALLEEAGHDCWHMDRNIPSGDDWQSTIVEGIRWCSDLVLLFGPESDSSKHVKRELNMADRHDKTIHWLRLVDAQPVQLEYLLSLVNAVDWFDAADVPVKLLTDLDTKLRAERANGHLSSLDDEPVNADPDSTEIITLFVDRLPERDALRQSLEAHLAETTRQQEPSSINNNLLTFYGPGGQGKSRLSRRLERWLQGMLPADDHWGTPPRTALTARWNLDQSHDRPQLMGFLAAFRRVLARTGAVFPEFDLAFAAFYVKTAGDIGGDQALKPLENELLDAVDALEEQVDLPVSSVLTLGRLRRIVAADRQSEAPGLLQPDALDRLLTLIGDRGDSPDAWQHIVAPAMDTVTQRLRRMSPDDRPTIAVFIDTFEAIQTPDRVSSEQVINALIAHLPLCLFVVTGRERLNWHEPDCRHVSWTGAQRWPSLTRADEGEPRQHELVYLSSDDTEAALRHALDDVGWRLSDQQVDELATGTQGWPLHVELLVSLIHDRSHGSGPADLTFDDLLGSFPALVRRLLRHLPDDVQIAVQAAAVVPSFDAASLRLCDPAIKAGSVARLRRTSLVIRSEDPFFPYKLHDEVSNAVVAAGSSVPGGWEDEDRVHAAEQLVVGLESWWQKAKAAGQHAQLVHVHAMAVRLCLLYELDVEWVKEAFQASPSHQYQRDLLPNVDRARPHTELLGLVQIYRALGLEDRSARLAQLRRIAVDTTSDRVRFRAHIWSMYAVRTMAPREAVPLAEQLLHDRYDSGCGAWPKPTKLVRRQYAVTLATAGKWLDLQVFDPRRTLPAWGVVESAHGWFGAAAARARGRLEAHLAAGKSHRFAMELVFDTVHRELLAGIAIHLDEVTELADHARDLDVGWARVRVAMLIGPWLAVDRPDVVQRLWDELSWRRNVMKTNLARQSRALFALGVAKAGGERSYLHEAQRDYVQRQNTSASDAPLGFLFEDLGLEIPTPDLPWLDDIEAIRRRWLEGWKRTLIRPAGWKYSEELYG